jgi:hypothetical protein
LKKRKVLLFSGIGDRQPVATLETVRLKQDLRMNVQQAELYQRIQQFSLDVIDSNLPFSHRLARENGWTIAYAQRVVEEYKKFTFLAIVAGHPVTPSDQVDQAWHLHLLYTQSYWEEFCPKVLQAPLHHNPTKGGQQERGKFNDWYSGTLTSYERFFQQSPPPDVWSPPRIRFGRELAFRRINTQQNWVLPKPDASQLFHSRRWLSWLSAFLMMSLALWATPVCAALLSTSNSSIDVSLATFLPLYAWTATTSFACIVTTSLLFQRFNRRFQSGGPLFAAILFGLFLVGSSWLAAGFTTLPGWEFLGFFVLSAIAGMVADFVLSKWVQMRSHCTLRPLQSDYTPSWEEFQRSSPVLEQIFHLATQCGLLCVIGLYGLGIARVGLGLQRQKPVGYLIALCLIMAVYLLWRLNQAHLKLPLLKTSIWILSILGTALLLFSTPQLLWVGVPLGLFYLWRRTPVTGRGRTTCVNGNCGDGGSSGDGGGGDGGGGGCGGGGCGGCGGG